jgi:repressor LexA
MQTYFKKISQLIDYKGYKNLNDFALNGLGYESSSKLNRLKDIGTKPSIDIIIDISNKFEDLRLEWLLKGEGDMIKNESTDKKGIPLVRIKAAAGLFNSNFFIHKSDIIDNYVIPKFKNKKVDFMLEIEGDSMSTTYNGGDIVACTVINHAKFIQYNKPHIVATAEQGIMLKRIRKGSNDNSLMMISDNKDYEPFEVAKEDITGIALVVGGVWGE